MQDLWQSVVDSFAAIHIITPSLGVYVALILSVGLLLCSAFVSASETAFFNLRPAEIDELEEERTPNDARIVEMRGDSEELLATILICNNLVNVAVVMLLNFAISTTVDFGNAEWLEYLCMTVLLTFLLLFFGEVTPKIYSAQHSLRFARFSAPVLRGLCHLCRPLSWLLIKSKVVTKHLMHSSNQSLTVDDLEKAMELTDQKDIAQESSMLHGIIRFGGEMAREVMTSRLDIVDLDVKTPFPQVLKCIVENNYSRIPVYQETQDNIKGVLYIKDLLPHLNKPANFRWQSLIRPPYFVPETKMIDDLLRDFQSNKVHIAIVVDEFGGTSGIVTMEDIIEEIVGEINDEYDEDEKTYQRLNQNTYIFEGKTLLADFLKIFNLHDDYFDQVEGEADTLAGLLLEIKGDFPELHERTDYGRFTFEVTEMDNRRILKIKVIDRKKMAITAKA